MAWTTPRTWVAAETVTASLMNAHVRDNLNALYGTTTSYTPQVDQGVSTNIAKTVTEARYVQMGRVVHVWIYLSMTGTGTAGSDITFTLPIAASGHTTNGVIGAAWYFDTGSQFYAGTARARTSTTAVITPHGAFTYVGSSPSIAVASGDVIGAQLTYVVA